MTEDEIVNQLGFRVKDDQIQSLETRKNLEDKEVPQAVRPATLQEKKMWYLLIELGSQNG